jgi:hypothetical protein
VTVTLQVAETNLSGARIVWEAQSQEPAFGGLTYTFTPLTGDGSYWIEAEVQWPDGRRAFAVNSITVSAHPAPQLSDPRSLAGGGFSFELEGTPLMNYIIQGSTNLTIWEPVTTNALPQDGLLRISDPQASLFWLRYYRAMEAP